MESARHVILSKREHEILNLIYEGNTDGIIARILGLSPNTIRTHRENLRGKFEVGNTASMLRLAAEMGIVGRSAPQS